jgi:hypothetical protein
VLLPLVLLLLGLLLLHLQMLLLLRMLLPLLLCLLLLQRQPNLPGSPPLCLAPRPGTAYLHWRCTH